MNKGTRDNKAIRSPAGEVPSNSALSGHIPNRRSLP